MRSYSSADVARILRKEAESLTVQQNEYVSKMAADPNKGEAHIRVAAGRVEGINVFLGQLFKVFREDANDD